MPDGPGKYDEVCTMARMATNADAVVVIVLNGERGSGFSVQSEYRVGQLMLADLLQNVVDELRKRTEP